LLTFRAASTVLAVLTVTFIKQVGAETAKSLPGSSKTTLELTIEQVAHRLNMPVETVERWIRQGKIPMQLYHGRYVIRSEMLERWAEEFQLKFHPEPIAAAGCQDPETAFDGIASAMRRGGIVFKLDAADKESCLRSAVEHIAGIAHQERPLVLEKLLERERLASTGIGHGIALPHPRILPEIELCRPQITTCFLSRPIDFDAVDGRPVSVVMVLLAASTRIHLALLSKLSFYLRDTGFREFLLSAPADDLLVQRVERMESEEKMQPA
jgi:nitrogen PTS system EIIA component